MAALVTFFILTILGHSWGLPSLTAAVSAALVMLVGYFHYRRRGARRIAPPVTPAIDDGVITADMKAEVAVRDGGVCQIKAPCCIVNKKVEYDHIIPHSWGGPTEVDNLQFACKPCNRFKSNNWAGTYHNQMTRADLNRVS
jgi:hypothetical protein